MPLTTNGRNYLADQFIGGTAFTPLAEGDAYLCVGNGNTAFNVSQTDLQGASKFRKVCDTSYPARTANADTFRATFGASEANFEWAEWGLANAPAGDYLLQRKVESLGTKVEGATWEFTVTDTWT